MGRIVWPYTLEIPTKHAPFGGATGAFDIYHLGDDWSGAAFVLAIANAEGEAPIFTPLTNAAAGSQGVSATYDAGMMHPDTGAVIGGTIIRPQIDEATLEPISWTPADKPLDLWFDLLVTPIDAPQRHHSCGPVLLYSGVGD